MRWAGVEAVIGAFATLFVINLAANGIAQLLYPTRTGDPVGRRAGYRLVFIASALAFVGAVVVLFLVLEQMRVIH